MCLYPQVRPADGASYLLPPDDVGANNKVHPNGDLPLSADSFRKPV